MEMLNEILNDGEKISLMGGSVWQINPWDIPTVCTWIPTAEIEITQNNEDRIFNYTLVNKGIDVSVKAMKLS